MYNIKTSIHVTLDRKIYTPLDTMACNNAVANDLIREILNWPLLDILYQAIDSPLDDHLELNRDII